jgi:hypothetical protein
MGRVTIMNDAKPSEESNAAGIQFLIQDLDLAMTFMDTAEATHIKETAERNHRNARTAYETVMRLLQKVQPNAAQQQEIDKRIAVLRARLRDAGQL